eukprot:TRINITY_DN3780_c0_g1_i2.p1 TRINITY_DN3780_c0_g1~~TRINITY_DN3780_c0_g1_i2.p1  ORF type:complete len:364 (-),score=88.83 TRINITY_DN3780_c0_g1_i2:840-1931(-)
MINFELINKAYEARLKTLAQKPENSFMDANEKAQHESFVLPHVMDLIENVQLFPFTSRSILLSGHPDDHWNNANSMVSKPDFSAFESPFMFEKMECDPFALCENASLIFDRTQLNLSKMQEMLKEDISLPDSTSPFMDVTLFQSHASFINEEKECNSGIFFEDSAASFQTATQSPLPLHFTEGEDFSYETLKQLLENDVFPFVDAVVSDSPAHFVFEKVECDPFAVEAYCQGQTARQFPSPTLFQSHASFINEEKECNSGIFFEDSAASFQTATQSPLPLHFTEGEDFSYETLKQLLENDVFPFVDAVVSDSPAHFVFEKVECDPFAVEAYCQVRTAPQASENASLPQKMENESLSSVPLSAS